MKLWIFAQIDHPASRAGDYFALKVFNNDTKVYTIPFNEIIANKFNFLYLSPKDYYEYVDNYTGGIYTSFVLQDEQERKIQTEIESKYQKTLHFFEQDPIKNFNEMNKKHSETSLNNPEEMLTEDSQDNFNAVIDFLKEMPRVNTETNLVRRLYQAIYEPDSQESNLHERLQARLQEQKLLEQK